MRDPDDLIMLTDAELDQAIARNMMRRCPRHIDGCPKHPNLTKPKPVPKHRPQPALRGSVATLVAVYHTKGRGNPGKRRVLRERSDGV